MSLLVRIIHLKISQPQIPDIKKAERTLGDCLGNLWDQHEYRSHSTKEIQQIFCWQSCSHYRFYISVYGGRAPLKQMACFITGTFSQENRLGEKLQIDLGWILSLLDITCLTLGKIFNHFEYQFFTFKFLHLPINFSFNKQFLSAYYMAETMVGTEDIKIEKNEPCLRNESECSSLTNDVCLKRGSMYK